MTLPANPCDLLRRMFDAAIGAAQPVHCIPKYVSKPACGLVIGAGKAAAAMPRVFEEQWLGPLQRTEA